MQLACQLEVIKTTGFNEIWKYKTDQKRTKPIDFLLIVKLFPTLQNTANFEYVKMKSCIYFIAYPIADRLSMTDFLQYVQKVLNK